MTKETIDPFESFNNARKYLKSGGDVNIERNGISLIEHILDKKPYEKEDTKLMLSILANPQCIIDKERISDGLYENFLYLDFQKLKTKEEKKTFINRFDLEHPLLIRRNADPNSSKKNYKTYWLSFFLIGTRSYSLFLDAKKYHSDYSKSLNHQDTDGLNCWQSLAYYCVSNHMSSNDWSLAKEILAVLGQDNPEGILLKNKYKEDAHECCVKRKYKITEDETSEDDKNFQKQIEYTINFLFAQKLEQNIPSKNVLKKKKL